MRLDATITDATVERLLRLSGVAFLLHPEHHHCTPNYVQVDCPQCSPGEHRWRLGIHHSGSHCTCWSCGLLPVVKTLSLLTRLSYDYVKEVLDAQTTGRAPRPRERQSQRRELQLPKGLGPLTRQQRGYLSRRCFDVDEIEHLWQIQGIGLQKRLSGRIWIPIRLRDRVVSWTTRAPCENVVRRYVNASSDEEEISAKSLLYGEEYATHSIVVVEGPLDVWRIGPGAVALMGMIMSKSQLLKVSKYPRRAVCLDREETAQRRARKLCYDLQCFAGETYQITLDSKDAGAATRQEIKEIRRFLNG